MRSRAVSLPLACWASTALSLPARSARPCLVRSSSMRSYMLFGSRGVTPPSTSCCSSVATL